MYANGILDDTFENYVLCLDTAAKTVTLWQNDGRRTATECLTETSAASFNYNGAGID